MKDILIFAGTGGQPFAEEMCTHLGTPLSASRIQRFAND